MFFRFCLGMWQSKMAGMLSEVSVVSVSHVTNHDIISSEIRERSIFCFIAIFRRIPGRNIDSGEKPFCNSSDLELAACRPT